MVLIKVQYDAYNRYFKLLDRGAAHKLDDGETYVLIADVSVEDLKSADCENETPLEPVATMQEEVDQRPV